MPYGETEDKEKVPNWLTYQVLMMNPKGANKLLKVCIPDLEKTDSALVFGMDDKELCAPKVQLAYDLAERGKRYYKKSGFEKFAPKRRGMNENPDIKLPPLGDPAVEEEMRMKETASATIAPATDKSDVGTAPKTDAVPEKTANTSEEDKEMEELQKKMKEIADKKKKKEEEAAEAAKKAEEDAKKKTDETVKKTEQDASKSEVKTEAKKDEAPKDEENK